MGAVFGAEEIVLVTSSCANEGAVLRRTLVRSVFHSSDGLNIIASH